MKPIYSRIRKFLGLRDLVVSFYTQKCQFNCTFCSLHRNSSHLPVSTEDINSQIDWIFDKYKYDIRSIQQFSCGNEASILDSGRFYGECMSYLLQRCEEIDNLQVLSLETRPEYITEKVLKKILSRRVCGKVDVTIGFETQDDKLRMEVVNKKFSKKMVEDRINLLGKLGISLTSYVMVKPSPLMSESEGIYEALLTIEYLCKQCSKANVDLIVYLNPTYISSGSRFERLAKKSGYKPPRIQSILYIIKEARRWNVPIYTGLWSEGASRKESDYESRDGYNYNIKKAIMNLNKTNDFSYILAQRDERDLLESRLSFL